MSRIDPVSEAVVLAGAGRAILLQLARPEVGYGVARHSDFASNPMGRLHGTLMYVYAVMAGTESDRRIAAGYVNRMHTPVHGPGDDRTPAYDARDPELQLWVAATLYDTARTVYERVLGHLPEEEADRLYARYAALGTALDVPAGSWPATRADFARYWRASVGALRVDDVVRAQSDALWKAERAPRWVRALMPLNRFVTTGLLPDDLRVAFGLPWSDGRRRALDRLWSVISTVYPRLPRRVRVWPQEYYLRRLRSVAPSAQAAPAAEGHAPSR